MCEKNKQLISWNEETKAIAVICSFTEDRAEDVLKQYVKSITPPIPNGMDEAC